MKKIKITKEQVKKAVLKAMPWLILAGVGAGLYYAETKRLEKELGVELDKLEVLTSSEETVEEVKEPEAE